MPNWLKLTISIPDSNDHREPASAQKDLKINTFSESKRETHENMDRNPNKSDRLSWQRLQQVHLNMN